jgi:hypothetical protein
VQSEKDQFYNELHLNLSNPQAVELFNNNTLSKKERIVYGKYVYCEEA